MEAFAVAAGIFASRIVGFVRDRAFAYYLGNDSSAGAFRAALRIPNLLQNLFGEGALSASFIPIYSKLLAEKKIAEARELSTLILSFLAFSLSLFILFGWYFAADLTAFLAPGFTNEVQTLTSDLVQIMLPGVGLLVLSAWCLGVLNSHRHFFLSYAAPILWSSAIILGLILFHGDVSALAWMTVLGAASQFFLQLPTTLKCNGGLTFRWRLSHPAKKVLSNFGPAVMTRGVTQINAYIDQILASYLGPQIISGIAYAQTLYMLPISLFGMAITAAELPSMAGLTGNDKQVFAALRNRQEQGLRRISFYVMPSCIGFILIGDVFISTLFQTGKFGAQDVQNVWWILSGSALALLANTQGRLITSGLWILGDTKTPLKISLGRVTFATFIGYLAIFPLRSLFHLAPTEAAAALSAGSSLAGWIEMQLAYRFLIKRIGHFSLGSATSFKLFFCAACAACVSFGLKKIVEWYILSLIPTLPPWVYGPIVIAFYGLLYFMLTLRLKIPEAVDFKNILIKKAKKLFARTNKRKNLPHDPP